MMPKKDLKPTQKQQEEVVKFVDYNFAAYKDYTQSRRRNMVEIYKEYSTFTQPKRAERETSFKVNKAHEVVNKILPRIMSKNPKRIVSIRKDVLEEERGILQSEEIEASKKKISEMADVIQDYLHYIFDQY